MNNNQINNNLIVGYNIIFLINKCIGKRIKMKI